MTALTLPTAEPFLIPGGRTGCLLIHGFTGTPKEMRWMGEYLACAGYSVLGIRLAGHATRPRDLRRTRWEDWLASVEDGLNLLSGLTDRVFAVGLSLGGVLALLAAARYPLAGVVAISTPYQVQPAPLLPLIRPLSWLIPSLLRFQAFWHDPQALAEHVDYDHYPTGSVAEVVAALAAMRQALPDVHTPTLLVHSRGDRFIRPGNMEAIYRALGCPDKSTLLVDDSGHVIPREPEKARVFQAVADFIARVSAPA